MKQLIGKNNSYTLLANYNDNFLKKDGKFGSILVALDLQGNKRVLKQINKNKTGYQLALMALLREIKYTPEGDYFLPVSDFFEIGDLIFLVRPFVDGINLKELIQEKIIYNKLTYKQKLLVALEVARAVAEIHQRRIIHKDIRPTNIILENYDELVKDVCIKPKIKLIDFGLAQAIDEKFSEDFKMPFSLIYAAPEQLLNKHSLIGVWTDIYLWGITFYEFFTGEKPWYSDNPEFLMNLQLNKTLPENEDINVKLLKLLQKATAKCGLPKPPAALLKHELENYLQQGINLRYKSMIDLINELEQLVNEATFVKGAELKKQNRFLNWMLKLKTKS
jgi:serine/threonine protein kinase